MQNLAKYLVVSLIAVGLFISISDKIAKDDAIAPETTAETTEETTRGYSIDKLVRQAKAAEQTEKPFDHNNIQMGITPDSTCFTTVGYDADHEVLKVCFRETRKYYLYYDVPESVYKEFRNADSLGSYFNKHIKGVYQYECIN